MIVTKCCNAAITEKHDREYPLGGSTWGINTVVPACESCWDEHPETVEACDICGEPSERLRNVDGDGHCPSCFESRLIEAIGILRRKFGAC